MRLRGVGAEVIRGSESFGELSGFGSVMLWASAFNRGGAAESGKDDLEGNETFDGLGKGMSVEPSILGLGNSGARGFKEDVRRAVDTGGAATSFPFSSSFLVILLDGNGSIGKFWNKFEGGLLEGGSTGIAETGGAKLLEKKKGDALDVAALGI